MRKLWCGLVLAAACSCGVRAAQSANGVTATVLAKSTASWDGSNLPVYPAGKPEITVLRIEIPAGAQLPVHLHPVINAGVLLRGELTVTTRANKVLRLKAGDALVEVVDTWHYGRNEGASPAEIIVFYAGAQDMPVTVNEARGNERK